MNLTEIDALDYDFDFWRMYWREVRRDLSPASALRARFIVGGTYGDVRGSGDWWEFSVAKIHDHQVVVLEA